MYIYIQLLGANWLFCFCFGSQQFFWEASNFFSGASCDHVIIFTRFYVILVAIGNPQLAM